MLKSFIWLLGSNCEPDEDDLVEMTKSTTSDISQLNSSTPFPCCEQLSEEELLEEVSCDSDEHDVLHSFISPASEAIPSLEACSVRFVQSIFS